MLFDLLSSNTVNDSRQQTVTGTARYRPWGRYPKDVGRE